jgi:hypothetical protein
LQEEGNPCGCHAAEAAIERWWRVSIAR